MKRLIAAGWLTLSIQTLFASEAPPGTGLDGGTGPGDGGISSDEDAVSRLPFTSVTIKRVVASHQDKIQACYEETLADREKVIEGKIFVAFTITPEGVVKKSRVLKKGTTLHDAKLQQCVVDALDAMRFPRPPDHRDHPVEYPFNLKAIR
jgi:hypothetical protein